jgi:Ca-activated chloride channel family protein
MLLRGSRHAGTATLSEVAAIAGGALGPDAGGYRAEFLDLVRRAQSLGGRPRE